MNPELTKLIAERLSKLHDTEVNVEQPGTVIQMTTETHDDLVTISANGRSLLEATSLYSGAIPGQMVVLTANGGPKSAFDVQMGDTLLTPVSTRDPNDSVLVTDASVVETARLVADLTRPHVTTLGREVDASNGDRTGHVTFNPDDVSAAVATADSDTLPDEVDAEFWKSLGMNGPEDMTPDKLSEITKKLQEFGQNLKRMQRETPTTMGVTVRVKHRSPKKRKRKR